MAPVSIAGAPRTVWRSRRGGVGSVWAYASVLVTRLGGRFCCRAHVECTCRKTRRQHRRCSKVRRYRQGPHPPRELREQWLSGEPLDYDHRPSTDWDKSSQTNCCPVWSVVKGRGSLSDLRLAADTAATEPTVVGSPTIRKNEKTNADETAWQDAQQKAAEEFLRGDGQQPAFVSVGVILPTEGHLALGKTEEAVIGEMATRCV